MLKILVPVDGSANATRAVEYAARLAKGGVSEEIVLLNVQEMIDAWEVRRFLREDEINKMQKERSEDDLRPARKVLDREGVRYVVRVESGPAAETIVKVAKDRGCDKIVMGTRGMGTIENLLIGSVATKVVSLTDLPVTLVK